MKIFSLLSKRDRIVASFGRAHLIRTRSGTYQLCGGSPTERSEAREWIALFLHSAVLDNDRREPVAGESLLQMPCIDANSIAA